MHSLTKLINGHMDCVMGCLMMDSEVLYDRLLKIQECKNFKESFW